MANISVGSALTIDIGAMAETVTVTAVTATTFSATTTKAAQRHRDAVSRSSIRPCRRSAKALACSTHLTGVRQASDAVTAAGLGQVLDDAARLRVGSNRSLSPTDERRRGAPGSKSATLGVMARRSWRHWLGAEDSVEALAPALRHDPQLAVSLRGAGVQPGCSTLTPTVQYVPGSSRAATLIAGITNEPVGCRVAALQSALRALYAEADWLTVVQPINDAMRIAERDALVAYILQQPGRRHTGHAPVINQTTTAAAVAAGATAIDAYWRCRVIAGGANGVARASSIAAGNGREAAGRREHGQPRHRHSRAPCPPAWSCRFIPGGLAPDRHRKDKLFEYFLIDAETQPPVETSRIRLALSSVQLFIERIVRNLEPQVMSTDVDATQWEWMKRYRVWQANREVFLWPENWLYPELRDDQSPFFQQMMSSLLQSDITDDAAANAYLDYLSNLEEVAKLEPCGLVLPSRRIPPTSRARGRLCDRAHRGRAIANTTSRELQSDAAGRRGRRCRSTARTCL